MKHLILPSIFLVFLSLYSCTVAETETKDIENQVTEDPLSDEDSLASREPEMDVVEKTNALQLRDEIDEYRRSIENTKADLEKGTLDLTAARAKISQDWQKLDFYQRGDEVVRIKTYPIAEKGEKTEEFYFLDDELVFALIESSGSEKTSMDDEETGEAFYYNDGELIVNADFKITEATEEEKAKMKLGTKLQNKAKGYLDLVYKSKD